MNSAWTKLSSLGIQRAERSQLRMPSNTRNGYKGWCWWIQPWGTGAGVQSLNGQYHSWHHHKYDTSLHCWCVQSPVTWEMTPSGWLGMIPPGSTRKCMKGIANLKGQTTGIKRSTSSPLQEIPPIIPDVWRILRCQC